MVKLHAPGGRHPSLVLFWTWLLTGSSSILLQSPPRLTSTTAARPLVYYAILLSHIPLGQSYSNFLSPWISAVIICTCIGTPVWACAATPLLIPPISSLATGSANHKKVTSDVSRILWLYYNDPVSLKITFSCLTMLTLASGHCF